MKRSRTYLTSPTGERIGPFRRHRDAIAQAAVDWPGIPQDNREENPAAWDMEIIEVKSR